jgi:hypothetical protein
VDLHLKEALSAVYSPSLQPRQHDSRDYLSVLGATLARPSPELRSSSAWERKDSSCSRWQGGSART